MSQNPTIPPSPKRPPAKPPKIPPVVEQNGPRSYHVNPYQGLVQNRPVEPPKRHHTPSEVDIVTARHDEQIKGLDRRVEGLEEVAASVDSKLDKISDVLSQEISTRKLADAIKEEAKVKEDHKTKRFQAILVAIPLILAPILGFYASYMSKPTPDYKTNTVVVAQYNQDSAKCLEKSKARTEFELCIREAQLKNTPVFEK